MEVIFDIENINNIKDPVAVTIGTFDGLHIGHREVINTVVRKSRENGYKSVVYTFSNIPKSVTMNKDIKSIITLDEKVRLIRNLGVDYLILIEFTREHMNIPAESFIKDILLDRLDIKDLVIGHDFRFGQYAAGDYHLLAQLKPEYQYELDEIQPIVVDKMRVSSTLIRKLLSLGDIKEVNKFLGRRHYYRSIVTPGKHVGMEMGFPTANLKIGIIMQALKPGVYITKVVSDQKRYDSITNVGFNPTFNQMELNFETYIFDFNGNLYNREISVEFYDRLRDEIKFDSKEKLIDQIGKDVEKTKEYFKSLRNGNNMVK